MKKLLAALAVVCALACLPIHSVQAQEATITFARIIQSGTYLYSEANADSGLFILPETYFVKITGDAGSYYAVEYLSDTAARSPIRGYCLKSDVSAVDYTPQTPYLVYSVDVTFRTDASGSLPDGFLTEYTLTASFYGTFLYGSATYYYVELNGEFGYVPASACPPLSYPENTEHTETEEQPLPDDTPQESGLGAVNIVLICALAVAALGAIYFLFRPAKPSVHDPFSDDAEDLY